MRRTVEMLVDKDILSERSTVGLRDTRPEKRSEKSPSSRTTSRKVLQQECRGMSKGMRKSVWVGPSLHGEYAQRAS